MKRVIRGIEYCLVLVLAAYANSLSDLDALRLGARLGEFVRRLLRGRAAVVRENLRVCNLSPGSDFTMRIFTTRCFQHIGVTAIELMRQRSYKTEDVLNKVQFEQHDELYAISRLNRGAVLMSAHIGNWELCGAYICRLGYPVDLLVKRQSNERVDRLINSLRTAQGMGVIYTDTGLRSLVRAFDANRFVAILADQYGGANAEQVELFGKPAMVHSGPAVLIHKYNLPLVFGLLRRAKDGRHHLTGKMVTDWESKTSTDIVQLYTDLVEQAILDAPEMWLWTHRRFKNLTDYGN
jgi:KDO2-lipid IV(A) lauroyltransferase